MGNRKQVLINLKEALEKVCENCCCDFEECKKEGFCIDYTNIERLPTVYAVEVVHGRWIETTSTDKEYGVSTTKYECSECACLTDNKSNYCPNCGACMDLED